MCTASRRYRGHRIRAIQLGCTWHASVHGQTGAILKNIESTSLPDLMAQAEWSIETRLVRSSGYPHDTGAWLASLRLPALISRPPSQRAKAL